MFESFIDKVQKQLNLPLPGENAQFQMAPISRERIKDVNFEVLKPKKSAVLVLIFPSENKINTILIQRPSYKGVHSAQVAFPGGKFEDKDIQLQNTALRETNEEIGIEPEKIKLIGRLSEVYINPSNFLVSPFIGFMNENPLFKADEREVEKIITTDIFKLNDPAIKGFKSIQHSSGYTIRSPFYDIEGYTVWGATAMMISELNAVITNIK